MISAEVEKGRGNKTAVAFGILCIMLLLATFGYASADTLTVAVEDEAAPWSQKDGSGFANDVVKAAFKASKVDILLQVVPYSRCKHMVVQGEVAACLACRGYRSWKGKSFFPPNRSLSVTPSIS